MVIRKLCEVYHMTPKDFGQLTMDQITLLACDVATLERTGTHELEVDELRARGILPELKPGEPKSYVQKLRKQQADEAEQMKKMSKRERRRYEQKLLADARARGEA